MVHKGEEGSGALLTLFLLFLFCICVMGSIIPIPQMRTKRPRECEDRTQAIQQ